MASCNHKTETPKLTYIHKKEEKIEVLDVLIPDEEKNNSSFTNEEVQTAIKKYISEKNLSNTYLSLLKNEFKIIEDVNIELQLKNSVEKKFLGEIEVELTKYIRDVLKNDFTFISSVFNQEVTARTAYTNAEIFEEMLSKKPELLKLKEALGLDTEF